MVDLANSTTVVDRPALLEGLALRGEKRRQDA